MSENRFVPEFKSKYNKAKPSWAWIVIKRKMGLEICTKIDLLSHRMAKAM